jgi:ribosomal protein S18 acetylase RimI-like enzyme
MNVEIRNIAAEELPALLELYRHLHETDLPLPGNDQLQQVWRDILDDPKMHCLVADQDGMLVGSCILTIIPNLTRGARPYGVIENVVTHVEHRQRGIGTQLLQHALQIAWEEQCYKVMLMTGSKSEAVHSFYERAGFKKGIKTGFIAVAENGIVTGGLEG